MPTTIIDPVHMTATPVDVSLNDYRDIQKAIGGRSFDVVRIAKGVRLFVDETARVRRDSPARFILPQSKDANGEPLSIYGKALLAVDQPSGSLEIVFPKERRVTGLDANWRSVGCFVSANAGDDPSNLNFQAILSDERFVAATRVVLATFEPYIINAVPSFGLCPMMELEIERSQIGAALDLYNAILAEFGYSNDADDEYEEEDDDPPSEARPNADGLCGAFIDFRHWATSAGEVFGPELFAPAYVFTQLVPLAETGVKAVHPHTFYWLCYAIGGRVFVSRVEPLEGGKRMKTVHWLRDAEGWGPVDVGAWDADQREANTRLTNNCIVQRNLCGFKASPTKGVFVVGDTCPTAGDGKKLFRSAEVLVNVGKAGRGRVLKVGV